MKKIIIPALALALAGCQTRVTWTKNPEQIIAIQAVEKVNGVDTLVTKSVEKASGGYEVTARSPLWADEALKGMTLSVGDKGEVAFGLSEYSRDLSTNAVTMAHNLLTDFAALAEKAAAAYATAGASLATSQASAAVKKAIASYITKGGNAESATVTCKDGTCTFTDGTVTEVVTDVEEQ